jgi:hypothetical protein
MSFQGDAIHIAMEKIVSTFLPDELNLLDILIETIVVEEHPKKFRAKDSRSLGFSPDNPGEVFLLTAALLPVVSAIANGIVDIAVFWTKKKLLQMIHNERTCEEIIFRIGNPLQHNSFIQSTILGSLNGGLETPYLRKVIRAILRTDDSFNQFCLDHFPQVYRRFANGLTRIDKENALLEQIPGEDIAVRLKLYLDLA